MYQVIIVIHVLLGLGVVGLILMQQGKGADAGAAFGTGGSGSVFGAQGAASFLSRATAILATLFFTTSLGLAVLNSQRGVANDLVTSPNSQQKESVIPGLAEPKVVEDIPAQAEPLAPAPVAPAATNAPVAAPSENLNAKPEDQVQDAKPETVPAAPPKVAEKPKTVKTVKKTESKTTKKTENKKSN